MRMTEVLVRVMELEAADEADMVVSDRNSLSQSAGYRTREYEDVVISADLSA
jgi:hypothetical protein